MIDLHNDAITTLLKPDFLHYLQQCQKQEIEKILCSIYTTNMNKPLQTINELSRTLNGSSDFLMHIEDAWFLDEQNIQELINLQPFSVGLTWNNDNCLAGGSYGKCGISNWGKTAIQTLDNSHICIDLAHLNELSFYQTCELAPKKVFCSHTCFSAIHAHPRNLKHNQIKYLLQLNGIVGITFVGEFLNETNHSSSDDVCKHILYFLENFGDDNLSIGTDFYGTQNLPQDIVNYKQIENLKNALIFHGVPSSSIYKIFSTNAKRFIEAT